MFEARPATVTKTALTVPTPAGKLHLIEFDDQPPETAEHAFPPIVTVPSPTPKFAPVQRQHPNKQRNRNNAREFVCTVITTLLPFIVTTTCAPLRKPEVGPVQQQDQINTSADSKQQHARREHCNDK